MTKDGGRMKENKILFLNPPYTLIEGIKSSAGKIAPLNLLYLIAYIRKHRDWDISFLDCEAEEYGFKEIKEFFSNKKFDVVAMTCPSPVFNIVVKIGKIAKEINPKIKIIVGGPHPTALPEITLKEKEIDFAVRGEGEETLKELLDKISKNKKDFENVKGIGFRDNKGKIVLTPRRELIANLDEIPFPARDVLDLDKYYSVATKSLSGKRGTSILGSRGCYYNCIHCISKVMWGQNIRVRSAKNIVDELEECYKKYGIREFKFDDDNLTKFKDIMFEMCREIIRRKLDIVWICMSRVDCITEELAREMKKAGCKRVSFGLESGNPKVLKLMRKGVNPHIARKAVKILNKLKIEVHSSFMLGNLGETEKTIRETIDFAKSLDLDYATFFITSPFPGTDLYDIAKQKRYINENTRWEQFAPFTDQNPIMVQDNLSPEELIKWQKRAFAEFYFRPKQIFKKLSSIRSLRQAKIMLEGISIFIDLQRKNIKQKPTQ